MYRTRGLLFPLVVIAIGVIVLLVNLGALSSEALQRLTDLWPLLLVILGLQLILNHTLPRQQASLIGLAATALIIAAALAYAVLAPASQFGTQHADSSQRLGGLTAGTLLLDYGAAGVDVRSAGLGDTMYQAHVDYPAGESPPTISLDQQSGAVEIRQSGSFSPLRLFGPNRRYLAVTLNNRIPWTIRLSGGASNVHVDLRELQISSLDLAGGVSNVDVRLGPAKGTVAVHASGGVSNFTLRAPSGSQWRISASGGVSGLTINGASSGAFGEFQQQSSGYTGATDRFDIDVSGGVSHLDFRTG